MIKELIIKGKKIQYNLQYKNVKNVNLRIKPDGTVALSANKRVKEKFVEEFLISKADFILRTLEKFKKASEQPLKHYYNETEIRDVIINLCHEIYPYFKNKGIAFPEIRFRKMTSRWGSCHTGKGVLTFNTNLMYAPEECIEYVVYHEFTHFLVANHSSKFYEELAKVCPCWKIKRQKLKEIILR